MFADIHSHNTDPRPDTIINLDYDAAVPSEGFYSIGLHPWFTDKTKDVLDQAMQLVESKAADPAVVAIGECGIDALKGGNAVDQKDIFIRHIQLSERLQKPLIIHAVRSYDTILSLKKHFNPSQQWIIHGFRGKPELARQLLSKGICLSYGEHFNKESVAVTPADMRYYETDMSKLSIEEIRHRIDSSLQCQ